MKNCEDFLRRGASSSRRLVVSPSRCLVASLSRRLVISSSRRTRALLTGPPPRENRRLLQRGRKGNSNPSERMGLDKLRMVMMTGGNHQSSALKPESLSKPDCSWLPSASMRTESPLYRPHRLAHLPSLGWIHHSTRPCLASEGGGSGTKMTNCGPPL